MSTLSRIKKEEDRINKLFFFPMIISFGFSYIEFSNATNIDVNIVFLSHCYQWTPGLCKHYLNNLHLKFMENCLLHKLSTTLTARKFSLKLYSNTTHVSVIVCQGLYRFVIPQAPVFLHSLMCQTFLKRSYAIFPLWASLVTCLKLPALHTPLDIWVTTFSRSSFLCQI